jgi:hypothetical protein
MRTFIFAVAAIVAASWATDQARAADRIPAFDIVRNCNAEVASAGTEKIADCTFFPVKPCSERKHHDGSQRHRCQPRKHDRTLT